MILHSSFFPQHALNSPCDPISDTRIGGINCLNLVSVHRTSWKEGCHSPVDTSGGHSSILRSCTKVATQMLPSQGQHPWIIFKLPYLTAFNHSQKYLDLYDCGIYFKLQSCFKIFPNTTIWWCAVSLGLADWPLVPFSSFLKPLCSLAFGSPLPFSRPVMVGQACLMSEIHDLFFFPFCIPLPYKVTMMSNYLV